AEDGIRDFHVTGVQTCALPISVGETLIEQHVERGLGVVTVVVLGVRHLYARFEAGGPCVVIWKTGYENAAVHRFACVPAALGSRSEERRVGKVCRKRRWTRK